MSAQTCLDCDIPGEGSCSRCHGKGKVQPDKSFGRFQAEITCPRCKGSGTRFDKFIEIFNNERPHEALDMKCPAEVYRPSLRIYRGLPDIDYPFHDKTIVVTRCGRICLGHKKINFSQVFAGQAVGIKEVHDDIWLVSFMDYDLGYFDLETRVLEPLENPFGRKVLPIS